MSDMNEKFEALMREVFGGPGPVVHIKRDPLICPGRSEHEFEGYREFEDGLGGETVCKHCGVGAMEHTMALEDANPGMWDK